MKYSIIATLGPVSRDESLWPEMLRCGVTAFRLNTSHLSLAQMQSWLESIEAFYELLESIPPLVLDLQGSKWRLGEFAAFELKEGEQVELVCGISSFQARTLPVPHRDFFNAAPLSNGEIMLNDAKNRLAVVSCGDDTLVARVIQGGVISAHKGVTFSACDYRLEALTDKDRSIYEQTRHLSFIRYALSYVKDVQEMQCYRTWMGRGAYLIAKLERQHALEEAAQIAAAADELWLCRGDLGAELGILNIAKAVNRFSEQLNRFNKPVMLAGQVLEHLTEYPTPTRSEICYLYDALLKGYRGIVLSDETAIGKHPLEACRTAAMFK